MKTIIIISVLLPSIASAKTQGQVQAEYGTAAVVVCGIGEGNRAWEATPSRVRFVSKWLAIKIAQSGAPRPKPRSIRFRVLRADTTDAGQCDVFVPTAYDFAEDFGR